jgi:hypothetical protein
MFLGLHSPFPHGRPRTLDPYNFETVEPIDAKLCTIDFVTKFSECDEGVGSHVAYIQLSGDAATQSNMGEL